VLPTQPVEPLDLSQIRRLIFDGEDPLGHAFCAARTAEARRRQEAILRESGKKISLAQLKAAMKTEDEFWENYSFRFWQKSRASARVDFKDIDPAKGCAAAYLAKYVSKNIDGLTNSGESMGDDDEAGRPGPGCWTGRLPPVSCSLMTTSWCAISSSLTTASIGGPGLFACRTTA